MTASINASKHDDAIASYVVTAAQMQQIEARLFDSGMPVAALMEKVAGRLTLWFAGLHDVVSGRVGVLAGPGHNGGDALVMARELHHLGYEVCIYQPFVSCKPLTAQHARYAKHLGIPFTDSAGDLASCSAVIDGWFGFGLTRPITDTLAEDVAQINRYGATVFSIDLPSGIHTDTGQMLGTAIRADYTACLGLWKRAFMQDTALAYLGKCELVAFDIPLADIRAVLEAHAVARRITKEEAIAHLPLNRSLTAHKYTAGHLLLIAGSRQYAGAALLSGLGAVASGVGMLTIAVPESIRLALLPQLPGTLLVGCPETEEGSIAQLPDAVKLDRYDAIALGPGLTATVPPLLEQVLTAECPLLLDADGLNLLSQSDPTSRLKRRNAPTVLTPHAGEFKRLFPKIYAQQSAETLPGEIALQAAEQCGAILLLKGARSAIAAPASTQQHAQLWFNPTSTPALARGGSGDVLTGLMGGLLATAAQSTNSEPADEPIARYLPAVVSSVWWHSQAAIYAAERRTLLGVDPTQLAHSLNPALVTCQN
ncbi:MAG: NAD(P)H-hydrate dehydratase [Cyanobacteria bacterium J06634_6]